MHVRSWRSVVGLVGAVTVVAGSAALYARQQPAGSVLPAKFFILNKTVAESIPVTLSPDSKFPTLTVTVASTPDTELSDRVLNRLAPPRVVWEYSVMPYTDADLSTRLSTAGRDGWELVSVAPTVKGNSLVFKRPIR